MSTRLVTGPAPLVTPTDVPGSHASDDASIIRIIASVQRTIDGPGGWLGRALGKQTLELRLSGFPCREWITLYGPLLNVLSVKYLDTNEQEQTVDPALYRWAENDLGFRATFTAPEVACRPDAVRIQYEAGYEAANVPPEAKQAVIFMTSHALMVNSEKIFLRSEEVDGVGRIDYTVFDHAGSAIQKIVDGLLQGLKVYS